MEKSLLKKKITYVLGLCAIALFSMFMFSACIFTLDTPKTTLKGGVLSWEAVASASGYNVSFEKNGYEQIVQTKNTKINISNYMSEVGEYRIKVQATTNSLIWNNSAYSTVITKANDGNLLAPKEFRLITKANQVSVSFENVFLATSYTIQITDPMDDPLEPIEVEATEETVVYELDITKYLTDAGVYKVKVKANRVHEEIISSSEFTAEKTYTKTIALYAPNVDVVYDENGEFNKLEIDDDGRLIQVEEGGKDVRYNEKITFNSSSMVVTLTEVGNAAKYIVSLYGTDELFESTTNVVTIPKSKLPKITTDESLDATAIQIIHAQVKSSSLFYNASEYSDGYIAINVPFNKTSLNKLKIKNPYYNFVGDETFDFCADTQSELNTLTYFAMANRIPKVHFIQNIESTLTSENLSRMMSEAKSTYYETQNTKSFTVTDIDATGLILYVENMVTGSPTETATVGKNGYDTNKTQVKYNVMQNYSTLEANSDKRYSVDADEIAADEKVALPILNQKALNKTVNVYTSDQLYLAVQGGNYPIFVGDSQAKEIWNKAVDVLVGTDETLGIIDSTMTETERALAIFDWVCYNNNYDYNLSSRSNEPLVQRFRGFYMEGMFLDGGQAVCDGISKTYSLLCNMAGVRCYKMSGMGTTNTGRESHAWNRVGIYNTTTEKYDYYLVDCTWNDSSLSINGTEELGYALIHKNFLTKDDGKHEEANPIKIIEDSDYNLSTTSYDYYGNKTVTLNGTDYGLLITNSTILVDTPGYMNTLVSNLNAEYAKNGNKGLNYLEIKIYNLHAPAFGDPDSNVGAIAADGHWYCFEMARDGSYTTYYVLHK